MYDACDNVIQFWQSLTRSLEANLLAEERGSLNCFVRGQSHWLNEMSMNGSDFHKCTQPLLLIGLCVHCSCCNVVGLIEVQMQI